MACEPLFGLDPSLLGPSFISVRPWLPRCSFNMLDMCLPPNLCICCSLWLEDCFSPRSTVSPPQFCLHKCYLSGETSSAHAILSCPHQPLTVHSLIPPPCFIFLHSTPHVTCCGSFIFCLSPWSSNNKLHEGSGVVSIFPCINISLLIMFDCTKSCPGTLFNSGFLTRNLTHFLEIPFKWRLMDWVTCKQ